MKIVTGRRGEEHVTSGDIQALNLGILGAGSRSFPRNYVLNTGGICFRASLDDATHLRIESGVGVLQGVCFRIEEYADEILTLNPGELGKNRIDLVCARYTKDTTTYLEDVELVVIEGTSTTGTPTVPTYTNGNIYLGDTVADFPMYRIVYDGLTPSIVAYPELRYVRGNRYNTEGVFLYGETSKVLFSGIPAGAYILKLWSASDGDYESQEHYMHLMGVVHTEEKSAISHREYIPFYCEPTATLGGDITYFARGTTGLNVYYNAELFRIS